MQMPLCNECLTKESLCNDCSQLPKESVDVSRFLFSMKDQSKSLEDASVKGIVDSDVLLIVTGKGDAAKVVGKGGIVVKALAKQFNKNIKVLEENDMKSFASDLLQPITVLGTNILFTPEGEIKRIRAPLSQKSKFHISEQAFSNIMERLYGTKAEIVFTVRSPSLG